MNKKMHAGLTLHQEGLVRDLITLDGTPVTLMAGYKNMILTPEQQKLYFDLTWINSKSDIGTSAFTIISDLLVTHSTKYACTVTYALRNWFEEVADKEVEVLELKQLEHLISKNSIVPRVYVDFIIPALRHWANQKLPGLSEDLIGWLDDGYKLEESGNGAYFALITNDPERGALTIQELINLHGALNRAYSNNLLGQTDYSLCWLFIGTGVRPIQVARMTKGDARIDEESPEGNEVTLMVPLAKGEGVADQGKWPRRAPSVLAECLVKYLDLPEMKSRRNDDRLFDGSPQELGTRLSKIFEKLDTWSDRLEGPIPVHPYRFRYTLATRAIAQGASDHEVARLLTHRKTTCIQFYRASMPMLQRPLRENLGRELEFFAKAFQGRLIEDLAHATRANDEDALILDFLRLSGKAVGACGTRAECHQHAPIACLPCDHFEPFYGAPWEELLNKILEDTAVEPEIRIKELNLNAISALHEIIKRRDDHLGLHSHRGAA
jgi:integrase